MKISFCNSKEPSRRRLIMPTNFLDKQGTNNKHNHYWIVQCNNLLQLRKKNTVSSKITLWQQVTCPRKPVVPLSIRGTSAAKHRRFTCRLASKLSSPFKTTLNFLKNSTLKLGSLTFAWYGVMLM